MFQLTTRGWPSLAVIIPLGTCGAACGFQNKFIALIQTHFMQLLTFELFLQLLIGFNPFLRKWKNLSKEDNTHMESPHTCQSLHYIEMFPNNASHIQNMATHTHTCTHNM